MDVFLSQLRGPEVTVRVGQGNELREFVVAKDVLCSKNEWFNSALKEGRFLESQTGVVSLPDDIPAAFEAFHYCLIAGKVLLPKVLLDDEPKSQFGQQLELLYEIWIFADKYSDPKLQDIAFGRACRMLDMATWDERTLVSDNLIVSFSKTEQCSPLRTITADYIAARMAYRPQDAGELLQELSSYRDFVTCLQESQGLMHSATKGDFPRYFKPKKHFQSASTGPSKKDTAASGMLVLTRNWQSQVYACRECGWGKEETEMTMGCICHGSEAEEFGCTTKPMCTDCIDFASCGTFTSTV